MEAYTQKKGFIKLILVLLLILPFHKTFSEGTKEIMPTSTDVYYLLFNRGGGLNVPFGIYTPNTFAYQPGTTEVDYRFNIRICNIGEVIKFGFKSNNTNVYYRIRRPSDGAIVVGPTLIPSAAAAGYIASYTEAFNGPRSVVGPTGYNDLSYTALEVGDYYIEFNRGTVLQNGPTTYRNSEFTLQYFDISVTSPTNSIIPGRIWSKAWHFADGGNAFRGSFYVYADDGIVTKLDLNGARPYWFSISCNETGVTNTGNPAIDRRSVSGASLYPQYKLFLNDPDPSCFPTGTFGNVLGIPTVTGCGSTRCINLNVDRTGNIIVLLDLNGIPGFQTGTSDRQISIAAVVGNNCVPWDGLDGLGNPVASGANINMQIDYLNGLTHFPLYDGEENRNGYIVTLVRPAGPAPRLFWDDSNIIPANYAAGTAIDGITNLTGCNSATGCHRWNSRGSNACPPCSETNNTWWYANIITTNFPYTNTTVTVDANTNNPGFGSANDFSACGLLSPIALNGSIIGPAGVTGLWSSPTGDGTFSNLTTMTSTYTPGVNDIAAGFVKIYLTSVGGICPPERDSMIITLAPPPFVHAGITKTACKNNAIVALSDANSNGATATILWTGGSGTFVPNNTSLNPTYAPSQTELDNNSVTLTLTGTGNALCPARSSTVTINYSPSPTVDAGADNSICANANSISLTGTFSAGASASWTSSSGCMACFSNSINASTDYTPSLTDLTNGTITFTLTASALGCIDVTDTKTTTIQPSPTVSAGADQSRCKNNATTTLAGVVNNSSNYTWTSSSGCSTCFTNPNGTSPNYTPSSTDLSNNSVNLTLTANEPGCNVVQDQVTITFTNAPTIDAGPNVTFCSNNPVINLTGTVTGPTGIGIQWAGTNGGGPVNGTILPNNSSLSATYQLAPFELFGGGLYIITTNNGNCNAVYDSIIFTPSNPPTLTVGGPLNVCRNNPTITVSGTSSPAETITASWTSLTGGTFSGASYNAATGLTTATYTLSATDLLNGTVNLRLTSTPLNPICTPPSALLTINVTEPPTVNAGADQTGICYNPGMVLLGGASSTGSGIWSGGAGTFTNITSLNATYNSTVAERTGTVLLTLTSTNNGNCNAVTDQISLSFGPQSTANAGTPITVCANNPTATLNGTTNTTGGVWSGGNGTFFPNANTLNASYTPTIAEITTGTVTLTLTTTGTGNCTPATSTVTITINPTPTLSINSGNSIASTCADNASVNLSVVLPAGLGVQWSGGSGNYSPTSTTNPLTYIPSASEILNGSAIITATTTGNTLCNPVSDQINITITPRPSINAGADQVICGNTTTVNLNGSVFGATGGIWTSNGTGTFANANALNTTYSPSITDRTNGIVTLTLLSTGNGLCTAVSDQMNITFTVVPAINAGLDMTACSNTLPVSLQGIGSPATWSGGTGTFSPSSSNLSTTYMPSPAEITAGSVTLTLTTNPLGACSKISDQVTITILPSPIANAGNNATYCGNFNSINLSGSINAQATGGFWTTTGLGTLADPTALNTTYTPAASEKPGSITMTLTTTGNASCNPHRDSITINFTSPVSVNAGPDQNLCNDGLAKNLNGIITGATGGTWTIVNGAGTINNPTNFMNASYIPNSSDLIVTLRLTTTGNPIGCVSQFDDIQITFSPQPTVSTGPNQTVCNDVAGINLTGTVTGALGQQWTTNGTGVFTGGGTTPNATYIPSINETGTFTFTLTTTGNGVCNGIYSSSSQVTIIPRPTINAGLDQTVCANNALTNLSATAVVASGGTWSTNGDGVFSGTSGNGLSTIYTPGVSDIANGIVTLRITSTGIGTCQPVTDAMVILITPAPIVHAGPDRIVCANNKNVALAGTVSLTNSGVWSTMGTGNFTGISPNGLNATYIPSDLDTTNQAVTLLLTSTNNGNCIPVTDQLTISITPAPIVHVGPDQTICADSLYVRLNANYLHATAGIWTTSGLGTFFNTNATTDTATYVPHSSERPGIISLTFTTTVQGACNPVSDNLILTVTASPIVNAGTDQTICSTTNNILLNGTKNSIPTGTLWTTSGSGTFVSTTNLNTIYNPSAIDKAAGAVILTLTSTGNGTCRPAIDQLTLNIIPQPVINPLAAFSVCADVYTTGINLSPTITNYSSILWNSTGSGSFGPTANVLNPIYYPSVNDTVTRNVSLTVTANGIAPCASVNQSVNITINPIPVINAGSDQSICNGSSAALTGTSLHAAGGIWSTSGSGTFAPAATNLTATYIPSPADTVSGNVLLTLTSTGMGTCNAVSDQVQINFFNRPIANAGSDFSICADAGSYMVNGTVLNASGGVWSSSSNGTFFPLGNLNTMYFPTASDTTNGQVILTFTTTGNGPCPATSDNLTLNITPIPLADAGPASIDVCISDLSLNLNGIVVNATGGFWGTQGDGNFSDENALNTVYTFGPNDKTNGTVLLTLISQGNGSCQFYTDTIRINFTPTTTIHAGPNRTICRTDFPITLQGSGTSGTWSGGTAAQFSNINALNATYMPTAAESSAPSLTLTLTSMSGCAGPASNVTFTFIDGPNVNVNALTTICTNVNTINLSGIASQAGTWTSTGSGTYLNSSSINTTYTLSATDKIAGLIRFTYTIPATGSCNAQRDTASIRINPTPIVNAGPDQTRCANALNPVTMNGSFNIAGGIQWYTDNGTNGPLTNQTSTNASYTPTVADIALSPIRMIIETTGNGFCSIQRDTMLITLTNAPSANIGPDTTMCADKVAILSATTSIASGGIWSSSGTGTFTPNNTSQTVSYIPSNADTLAGLITITYQTTGNGLCAAVNSVKNITLTEKPMANAGSNETICSGQDSTQLVGSSFINASGILWRTTGTGRFSPNATTLNAYYVPSASDKANGGAILSISTTGIIACDTVSDYKSLIIIPSPVASVSAGFDQTMCRDENGVQLTGFISIATRAKWDCGGVPCGFGAASFTPDDFDLNSQFIPTPTEKNNGSITIRLTTTDGNGICAPVYDEMTITVIDPPQVNAGNTQRVCADTAGIQLNGLITHATLLPVAYEWKSSGGGIFTPNAFVANPIYIPSSLDTARKNVEIILTSKNNGTCQEYTDTVLITIDPMPIVYAGSDKTTCANISSVNLFGTMLHANAAQWSTAGTGVLTPQSINGLNTTYTSSIQDQVAGTVLLTLTTNDNTLSCKPVRDNMVLTLLPTPIVDAGPDITVCADNRSLSIAGNITYASDVVWTTNGTGIFNPSNTTNTLYSISDADTTANQIQLILSSNNNGSCNTVYDTTNLIINSKPVVTVGTVTICEPTNGATLSGNVVNAGGGLWTSSGTGNFTINAASLNATYFPSTSDINLGNVTLTLTSTANGLCNSVSRTTNLSFPPLPIANAGPDQFICLNATTTLSATLDAVGNRYEWSTTTGNIINPNATSINILADKDTSLVLTVYDSKNCASISDTIRVRTFQMPTITIFGTTCLSNNNSLNATSIPLPVVPGQYQWNMNGIILTGQNGTSINPTNIGSYQLLFAYGVCQSVSNNHIINPVPQFGGIDKTNCVNNPTVITTSSISGGSQFTYSWQANPTIQGPTNGNAITVINGLPFDTMAYQVTITNEFNCSTTDSVYLITIGRPIFSIENDTLCNNEVVTLDATPINFGIGNIPSFLNYNPTYSWIKDGININNNTSVQPVTQQGTYIVQVTIGDCSNIGDTATILYHPTIANNLGQLNKFCSSTDSVAFLDATVIPQSGYTYSYYWIQTNEITPTIEATIEGEYVVMITSTLGSNSCIFTDTTHVTSICPPRVFVPNVFTPNGNANKTFKVYGADYTGFSITIFNRWGEVIFSSTDKDYMNNEGWDGTYLNEPMPQGVYPYIIYYDGESEEYSGPYRKEGDILLLR